MPPNPEGMEKAERAAAALSKTIEAQFKLSAEVAALDIDSLSEMNRSAHTFYAGTNERISHLVQAARAVQTHSEDAKRFAVDMDALLQKARRLEALVDRLDEYTLRQEAALSRK